MDEQTTLCTFVAGLPVSEYDFEIRQLSQKLTFDRDEVFNTIEAQYNQLRGRRTLQQPMRSSLTGVVEPGGVDTLAESKMVVGAAGAAGTS